MNKNTTIPLWKRWLSHVWEVPIATSVSMGGAPINLTLSKGRLLLCASNAIYSFDDLYVNFAQAFHQMNKPLNQGDQILILGMGLGSIPYMLDKYWGGGFEYTFVEIDKNIIGLASEYSLQRLRSRYDIYCTDAYGFMLQNKRKYDLICMDVFVDDLIPEDMSTVEFLKLLRSGLKENGLLLFNRLYHYVKDKIATDQYEKDIFEKIFPDYGYIEIEGNRVYFSDKLFLNIN